MKYFIFITIFVLIIPITSIFAQNFDEEPNITLDINPSDPTPGEYVTASVESYEVNLDLAYITWKHNKETKSGFGETEFKTKISRDTTMSNTIIANIVMQDGQKIERQITISGVNLDISWEAINTYAPPFYMGKRIPIRENFIRVAVIGPNNKGSGIAYSWKRNGKAFNNSGGGARPYIDFTNTEIQKNESIDVSLVSNNNTTRNIQIPLTQPKILFYEYDSLNGLNFLKTIKNTVVGYENVVSIYSIPIGFNAKIKPIISWNLSGQDVNNQENPYLLSFNKPVETGLVNLSVDMENIRTLYQRAKSNLELNF
jgi:hypothetical protein